jgi:cellulose synthase/poly-beta-1,6-N-acetylglucosamine synthase-like glycosyltransferase
MTIVQGLFWLSGALIVYAYVGYPLVLWAVTRGRRMTASPAAASWPGVSIVVPVHNEHAHIDTKVQNTLSLDYPGPTQILFVSDGSTDDTVAALRKYSDRRLEVLELVTRQGKAAALNAGLARATQPLVVFSDASIVLERQALREVVAPFADPEVGCVSGEDRIPGSGGEAIYGRYELFIRRQESRLYSIVGASGCFYAQRRALCGEFVPNVAPDFLSVLRTVEQGYRAVSAERAVGTMAAVERGQEEFQRKVRTLLRGITALTAYSTLMNPFRHGRFAFALASHKLMRWLVPFFMLTLFATTVLLAPTSRFYLAALVAQVAFFLAAAAGFARVPPFSGWLLVKAAGYLTMINVAALVAWIKFVRGVRQELWTPSQRAQSTKS